MEDIRIYKYGEIPEKYQPQNRKWQAIATVECTGGRVWAAWMAGGVTEPDPDNYIVAAISDDGGKSFIEPFMIIDCDSENLRGRDPVLWKDGETLWLYYGFEKTYGIKIKSPEAAPDKIVYEKPIVVFEKGMILNKPFRLKNGELICSFDEFDKTRGYAHNSCFFSPDGGESWIKRGEVVSLSDGKLFQEGTFVEKNNGELFALTRIELAKNGGLEESFSPDGGRNWNTPKFNLEYPFYGPGSKCYMRRLKSGNLLFVNNNSADKSRVNMSAYVSEDDGNTWNALLLDYRDLCAYPDACEDDFGNIYVIYDCGRRTRNEIVLCKFTEADVFAGKVSGAGFLNRPISKDSSYEDVAFVKTFNKNSAEIVLKNGKELTVCGKKTERIINNENYEFFDCREDLERYKITDRSALFISKK